ncbi:MAG: hypothetical protein J6K62_06245 [Clostridia bacterium]|nr:hypothetical protein [Clostridia bacterium]
MKHLVALLLVITMMLITTACSSDQHIGSTTAPSQTPTTVPSMVPSTEGQLYTEMGVAVEQSYFSGGVMRNPWDVEMYNGRLYVASGNYDTNAGPVSVWYYDFDKKIWEIDTILPDEQITRFNIIDSKMYIPGVDPKSSWDMGTYYRLDGTEWETILGHPNAAHNFDIVKYDGKLFAGLGAKEGCNPILVTTDEETWAPVEMYKNGVPVDTTGYTYVRVYDFFTLKGELYAYFSLSESGKPSYREIYRYDGEKFVWHSDMIKQMSFSRRNTYTHFHQRVEYKGYQYITNGNFYRTADMITAEAITLGGDPEVNDLRVIGDKLYVLCSEEYTTDEGNAAFYNSLQMTTDGVDYTEVFRFSYPVRALSFTYEGGTVFLGMGFGTKAASTHLFYDENGMILAINQVL